jgi:uncharacterized alkaline shock family protein YloU
MPERFVAGKSIVTRRAIVDIIRIAVQGSYGVMGFSDPSLGRRLLRWAGLDRPGVRLTTEKGLCLDLYITVASGVPVAEVARQVDSAVRYSIRQHLGTDVRSLSIHVDGFHYQPASYPASDPPGKAAPAGPVSPGAEVRANSSASDEGAAEATSRKSRKKRKIV